MKKLQFIRICCFLIRKQRLFLLSIWEVERIESQRLCQAHFYFCERYVQNFKHHISKKEKELAIPTAQLSRSQRSAFASQFKTIGIGHLLTRAKRKAVIQRKFVSSHIFCKFAAG